MKYQRLTKEQLEELHLEFANFLASQNIDKVEWDQIKKEKPEVAEQEIDIFSDLIWEGTLNQTKYLEHYSKNHIFLFEFENNQAFSIIIKTQNSDIDFLTSEGLQWLTQNINSEKIEILKGNKQFENKNEAIFNLIKQGAIICKGEFYNQIKKII